MNRLKVLVVGDDSVSNNLLRAILESEGLDALCVNNGLEALNSLNDYDANLIISDGKMPLLDGFGLAFEVKNNPRLKNIPFYLYTATYSNDEHEKRAMEQGVNLYLRKSGSIRKIIHVIRDFAAAQSRHDTATGF